MAQDKDMFRILKFIKENEPTTAMAIASSNDLSLYKIRTYLAPLVHGGQVIELRGAPGDLGGGRTGPSASTFSLSKKHMASSAQALPADIFSA